MKFKTIEELKSNGFTGFKSVAELRLSKSVIPDAPGVYFVLFPLQDKPEFINPGAGGFFKGKDPNVEIATLKAAWVDGTPVIYIGKAGASNGAATLRSRIGQYLGFGAGRNVGHYGGRYIWQLKNHEDLLFCWKPLMKQEPHDVEVELQRNFAMIYGKMPFANLV